MKHLLFLTIALMCTLFVRAQAQPSLITLPGTGAAGLRTVIGQPEGGFLLVASPTGGGTSFIHTTAAGVPIDASRTDDVFSRVVLCGDSGFLLMSHVFFQYTVLVRTDKDLNVQWAKRLIASPQGYMPSDIAELGGAHYLVGSVQEAIIDPGLALYGTWAAVIHKLDGNGVLVDQCIVADTVHDPFRYGLLTPKLAPAADGWLYMCTSMLPQALAGTCNRQPTVIKLNGDLDLLWCNRYPMTSYNEAHGLSVLANGDLALMGHYTSNWTPCANARLFFDRLDTSGAILQAHAYHHPFPSSTGFGPAVELPDGTLMLAHNHEDPNFGEVPFFDHLSTAGAVLGSVAYHRSSSNAMMRLAVDGDGAIAACRLNSTDTLLFTPVSVDPSVYCDTVANTTLDSAITVNVQPYALSDHLTYPFTFADTLFDPFVPVAVNTLSDCDFPTSIPPRSHLTVDVSPNPSHGQLMVRASSPIETLVVTDASGRVVHRSRPLVTDVPLEIHDQGIYCVRIAHGGSVLVGKVVIEGH